MFSAKSTLSAVATMVAMAPLSTHAHMILKEPHPYGVQTKGPLAADGSDFPCKGIPYTVNTMNEWPVGSTQQLAFIGTAVHGGGSCQVAVTTDPKPTKESKFKVIHSFEGGCPASIPGNYPDLPGQDDPNTFPFEVIPELPNGQATMAWVWWNKVGNREMYMACAPVTVTGGSNDTAAFDGLPDMARANSGGDSCTTVQGRDYTFANPGKYKTSGGTGPFVDLCAGGAAPGGGAGSGSASSPAPVPAPAPAPANPVVSSTAPVSSAAPISSSAADSTSSVIAITRLRTIKTVHAPMPPLTSAADGIFAPLASPAPQPTTQPPQAPACAVPAPTSGNDTATGTTCSPDGSLICSADGTQFAICSWGHAVFGAVAQGTKCTNGTIGTIAKRNDYSHRNQRSAV
ncbi:hypothetical protein EJ02DRAFT_95214 [Clathrospora elynae]|uniref:Lytic polysaccharide monooxygenase n=1 Tax=Clathrospora elynae TaxID=706981 RepID=A0A6A5SV67_9PLEO|nr:hypothetical protein EJ02DRAFT_95214 [Clathrospora elynae]